MSLAVKIKEDVLLLLEGGPKSTTQVAKIMELNYYTVRNSLILLKDEGLITQDKYSSRNSKWFITSPDGPNSLIPRITSQGNAYKLQDIIGTRHNKSSPAVEAINKLPRHITRLFMIALRLNNTGTSQKRTIASLKIEMEQDLQTLENICSIYRQVLSNPRNFKEDNLAKYVNDVSFKEAEITDAYAHYFPEGD